MTSVLSNNSGPLQGSNGVDIDMIPISTIDHVEILQDGAAAFYGSDAAASVIEILLHNSVDCQNGTYDFLPDLSLYSFSTCRHRYGESYQDARGASLRTGPCIPIASARRKASRKTITA